MVRARVLDASQEASSMAEQDNVANSRDVQLELRDLAGRDWQLWSIVLLVLVVCATGFVTLGLPGILWGGEKTPIVQLHFLPQLISGLIVLVGLLNAYLVNQKRQLDKMRDGLIRNVMEKGTGDNSPIIDRLTKVFGADYVDIALEREIARADRNRSTITLALFDIAGIGEINRDFGVLAGDYLLLVTGQLLKKTFRGADTVCRFGGDQFLVILPETSAAQAEHAFARVSDAINRWNENSELTHTLSLHLGTATYVCGVPAEDLLTVAKTSLQTDKQNPVAKRLGCARKAARVMQRGISVVGSHPEALVH
jgi:diguanylate cyclase (GGDEF)-like protein